MITRTTGPAVEPVSVAEAMEYCRVTNPNEVKLIARLIRLARTSVEDYTGRVAITTGFRWQNYRWPDFWRDRVIARHPWYSFRSPAFVIKLGRTPVQSITNVKYWDASGAQIVWADTNYKLDAVSEPARLVIQPEVDLPQLKDDADIPDAVSIDFVAGVDSPDSVDERLRHAVMLLVNYYYNHRDVVANANAVAQLPKSYQHLLNSIKVYSSLDTQLSGSA